MAKLPSEKFHHENQAGETMAFTSTVTIDVDGTFNAVIPDELAESASSLKHPGASITHSSRGASWRVSAKRLDDVKAFVRMAMANHLKCEVIRELVIAYGYKLDVSYALSDRGAVFPTGYEAQRDSGKDGGSNGEGYHWRGDLNGSGGICNLYRVGLAARVFEKVTFRRPTGEKVKYERPQVKDGTPAEMLNKFVGLVIKPEYSETMPYSDEAALFFYEAMLAMCTLAERVHSFMGDRNTLMLAIEKRAGFLLTAPVPAPAVEAT